MTEQEGEVEPDALRVDRLQKILHNVHKGRQIDGQGFVNEDEYSGYEAAISDLIEVFSSDA